jgi:hypothetical protein
MLSDAVHSTVLVMSRARSAFLFLVIGGGVAATWGGGLVLSHWLYLGIVAADAFTPMWELRAYWPISFGLLYAAIAARSWKSRVLHALTLSFVLLAFHAWAVQTQQPSYIKEVEGWSQQTPFSMAFWSLTLSGFFYIALLGPRWFWFRAVSTWHRVTLRSS